MSQVDAVRTLAVAGQVIGALMAAGVSREAANIIASQSADETASWKAMYNWNLGNITAVGNEDYVIESSSNSGHFRAYGSILDGAQAMVDWVTSHGALSAAEDNDVASYVQVLAQHCYLGCIGQTDQTGHTVSQADYDNYQINISSRLPAMQAATPIAPGWSNMKTIAVFGTIAAAAFVFAAARAGESWVPKTVRRLVHA
jgi:hypothetical protein